jgi:hypothetical protein
MRRRDFVACCASGVLAASVPRVQGAENQVSSSGIGAISALKAAKQLQVDGKFDEIGKAFHSDALYVEPGSLTPVAGRAAIVGSIRTSAGDRKLLYFYYRQPETVKVGNSVIVISNYEAGSNSSGQTIEETGKSSSVVLVGATPPLIALEMIVPNLYAGSYGALGTALTSRHLGIFPVRALGPVPPTGAKGAGGGENDALYDEVQQINNAWVTGNPADILKNANKSGVFLIGDYSPFYIAGTDAVKEHFADFYKTSKVNSLRSQDPLVRIWGDTAGVYFDFDLDYNLGGKSRRSPGRAVYTFARTGSWRMAACAASHLVLKSIGDPYPVAAGPS